jgi:tetratricopeptide (TPR) repeat protein
MAERTGGKGTSTTAQGQDKPLGAAHLIGRDAELARLEQTWLRVEQRAQPHLVTVLGEPGIGKSRLVAEFERRLPVAVTTWHGRCLPYGEALGYWALSMVLKEAAGIVAEDDPEAARAKLGMAVAVVMGPGGDPLEVARHLALLSGLDVEADGLPGGGDQRVMHASARRFLEAAARQRPLCLVFDDIQWADDAMLDLIEAVAGRVREVRLLMVTLARPELVEKRAAWGRGVRSFTSLPLEALDEAAERELMLALVRQRGLAATLADKVGRSAGGNPLFAEELVAMMAEGAASAAATAGATAQVPSLIKMLIAARLDSLPAEERIVIQLASIFGKVFWESGLRALDTRTGGHTAEPLVALEHKDLLRGLAQSQFRGDREYTFKHDLIRDVAYDRLPKAERRALHGRAADWLEHTAGEQVESYFDQLAHHAVQAGQQKRAMGYLILAAERASRASAYRHAAALLGQAIAIAEGLGQGEVVTDLHARRGNAFVQAGLWADARPELVAALAELPAESPEKRAPVLFDLATISFWLFDVPGLRRYSSEAMTIAESVNRDDIKAGAIAAMTLAHSSDGDSEAVVALTGQSLQLAGDNPIPVVTFGAAITSLNFFWLGRFDEAATSAQQAVGIARKTKNTQFTIYALPHLGLALAGQGKYAEAEQVFAEAQRYCREFEIWPMLARALVMSSGYHYDVFDFAGHAAIVQEGHELARTTNVRQPIVSGHIDLLFNSIQCGDVGRAEQIVNDVAETVANAAGNHGWLWRLRLAQAQAELALARGDWEKALRLADAAIAQSQAHGRVKYHVFGLGTRASALAALGRKREAIADARRGVDLIRPIQAPALFVRAAAGLLALEGDDALLAEGRDAIQRTSAALTSDLMRERFEAAEPVRLIVRFSHLV